MVDITKSKCKSNAYKTQNIDAHNINRGDSMVRPRQRGKRETTEGTEYKDTGTCPLITKGTGHIPSRSYLGTATIPRFKSIAPRCQHHDTHCAHLKVLFIVLLRFTIFIPTHFLIIFIILIIFVQIDYGILFILIFGDEVPDVLVSFLELHLVHTLSFIPV